MSTARTLARLCDDTLARLPAGVARPDYDRRALKTGIVHFGPGAFHRAHQAYVVDQLLSADPRWGICDVALRSTSITEALSAQGGLYTIAQLDAPPRFSVIGSVREALSAAIFPQALLARLTSPHVRVVTMTVTENGYCLTRDGDLDVGREEIAHDLSGAKVPQSLIGWLVEGLWLRQRAALPPFTMISCDNVSGNGARLKRAVLQFAGERDRDLARWIEQEARFPSTMVDSITPATDEALKSRVAAAIGAVDMVPVQREPFVQWVMEAAPPDGPDWAGAGVTVTRDVAGYEHAKLRILNGAHSTLAYLGLLRGRQSARDAMGDAVLAAFVRRLVEDDIAPTLTAPVGLDLRGYIDTILTRIGNPAITHHLGQIAWDGSQKLPYRLFGVIEAALRDGKPLARLAVPVAAWMRFVRVRAREGIELIDPLSSRLMDIGTATTGAGAHDVMLFRELEMFAALGGEARFMRALAEAYDAIGDRGALPGDGW